MEIPAGSGNRYRYTYHDGATKYLGPVGYAPEISEEEFLMSTTGIEEGRKRIDIGEARDMHNNISSMFGSEGGRRGRRITVEGDEISLEFNNRELFHRDYVSGGEEERNENMVLEKVEAYIKKHYPGWTVDIDVSEKGWWELILY